MRDISQACIYCGSETKITSDHIPPKSFFPRPRPSNLITVPACQNCNQRAGTDEEYFLATMMLSYAGETSAGKALWGEKIERMYEKNRGLRTAIGRTLTEIDFKLPNGGIKRRMALAYDQDRLYSVVRKIIRGLHFIEQRRALPVDWTISTHFIQTAKDVSAAAQFNGQLRAGTNFWPGVFQYRAGFVPENPDQSVWLLLFWETHTFWCICHESQEGST